MLKQMVPVVVVLAAVSASAQPAIHGSKTPPVTSVETTLRAARLTTFLSLLDVVGLKSLGVTPTSMASSSKPGPRYHTLFVPTDFAFARMGPGAVDTLRRDPDRLRAFLLGHLVEGQISIMELPVDITDGTSRTKTMLKTRQGSVLSFTRSARPGTQFPEINKTARVGPFQDVRVSDFLLVIHEIDAVLILEGSV